MHTLDVRTSPASAQVMIEPSRLSTFSLSLTIQVRKHCSALGLPTQLSHGCNRAGCESCLKLSR
jgi:hypothetical protein